MAAQLPRVIDRPTGRAAGFTDGAIAHRITSGRWAQLHRGVYFTRGAEPLPADRLAGALLAAGPGAALTGAAALAQWRVRNVRAPDYPLILVPMGSGTRGTATLRVRRTAVPFRRQIVNDLHVVGIARAVTDHCLGLRPLDDVRGVVSDVIRRQLCTVDDLSSALDAGARRGSANLRIAVEDAAFGAWSVPEAKIGRALRAVKVPPFEQNVPILGERGALLGKVDVWWRQLRAALEVLGAEHHSAPDEWTDTVRRAARLESYGIAVMQVPAIDILQRTDEVVDRVRRWLSTIPERRSPS